MATDSGISHKGRKAEQRFREITGATKPDKASAGDALLDGRFVEVKETSTDTLNQVRPVKYSPLVAFDKRTSTWHVVPPDVVVRLSAQRKRGQHTENPFESVTLNLAKLSAFSVAEGDLHSATIAAFERGDGRPDLKDAMKEVRDKASELAKWSRQHVSRLLKDAP